MDWEIKECTDDSTSNYVIHPSYGDGDGISGRFFFDYAVRVANGNRPEQIGLHGGGGHVGLVAVDDIDAPLDQLNELLLDDQDPMTESDLN